MRISDWSSDVCSSDLARVGEYDAIGHGFCAPSVENLYQRIRGQASDSIMAASSAPESGSRATTKMVSSPAIVPTMRSEERRVGKECVSTCSSRGSSDH